jgi:hypothetical protein
MAGVNCGFMGRRQRGDVIQRFDQFWQPSSVRGGGARGDRAAGSLGLHAGNRSRNDLTVDRVQKRTGPTASDLTYSDSVHLMEPASVLLIGAVIENVLGSRVARLLEQAAHCLSAPPLARQSA